jgi:flagellin
VQKSRLSDIDVTSQEGAQKGISIVEAAIVAINKVKADLGSVQNQLTSTAANLTTTQLNVTSAESQIRDVDFAEESSNFSKMQILMQAGTFAMAQANASSQNVMRLLQ